MKRILQYLIFIFMPILLFAHTNTTITSRQECAWPDLGYEGGSGLHSAVTACITTLGNNSNTRFKQFTAIADSTLVTIDHNLGAAFAEYRTLIFTGTSPSFTRVEDPASAGWVIAAGTNPLTDIDITTPSSGSPHTFAIVVIQANGVQENITLIDQNEVRFREENAGGTNYIALKAPDSVASNLSFKLPSADGSSGQVLKTDGSQNLSFVSAVTDPTTLRGEIIRRGAATLEALQSKTDNRVLRGDGTDVISGQIDDPDFFTTGAAMSGSAIGIVTTGTQTFAGAKTLTSDLALDQSGDTSINFKQSGTTKFRTFLDTTFEAYRIRNEDNNDYFIINATTGNTTIRGKFNNTGLSVDNESSNNTTLELQRNGGDTQWTIKNDYTDTDSFNIIDKLGTTLAKFEQDDDVFINVSTIDSTADICTTGSGTGLRKITACASSKDIKNIRTVNQKEIDDLYKLRGVNFDWKNSGKNDFGLIAEEVNELYPQLVPKNSDDQPESVNYKHIVGILVEALKQQKNKIDSLETRLANLEQLISGE